MEFNPSKCKIMCFTTKRDPPKREYVFSGETLEEVDSHPYLGDLKVPTLPWDLGLKTFFFFCDNVF